MLNGRRRTCRHIGYVLQPSAPSVHVCSHPCMLCCSNRDSRRRHSRWVSAHVQVIRTTQLPLRMNGAAPTAPSATALNQRLLSLYALTGRQGRRTASEPRLSSNAVALARSHADLGKCCIGAFDATRGLGKSALRSSSKDGFLAEPALGCRPACRLAGRQGEQRANRKKSSCTANRIRTGVPATCLG